MKRKIEESSVVIWFRNDLRIHDNKALCEALEYAKSKGSGQLHGVFILSEDEIKAQKLGYAKVDFILRNLESLASSLLEIDISFSVINVPKGHDYASALVQFCQSRQTEAVFFNKETDPIAFERDLSVKNAFDREGICYRDFHDQCVVQEGLILTKAGKPYGMFTPFKNTWLAYLKEHKLIPIDSPAPANAKPSNKKADLSFEILSSMEKGDLDLAQIRTDYPAGEREALNRLESFLADIGPKYDETRNYPSMEGTSKLSAYLAVGAISPRLAVQMTQTANGGRLDSGKSGLVSFISELCWRDFYRHILYHFPQVSTGQPFKSEAANIEWREGPDADMDFQAWASGKTGVPIVDAAMMQLKTTAWMHNRLRMITSMYLTKHLLISWKQGEDFFAKHLIDYDFASNNGGWQWSSSTGTDSQPYFRIFNPYTQSENYDKDGEFIKKFLPDLRQVPQKAIHNPNALLSGKELKQYCPNYPKTLIEHTFARNRALEVFKKAFKKA